MKMLISLTLIFLSSIPLTAIAGVGNVYKSCTENQVEILEDSIIKSHKLVSDLKAEVEYSQVKFPHHEKALKRVDKMLNCIAKKLPKISIECKDLEGAHGRTIPVLGKEISIDPEAISYESLTGNEYTSSVIIHEVSHKCGATDGKYFHFKPYPGPSSAGVLSWTRIASTYQYFVMWGFCIPGENCSH